ncbi:hypothetical protein H5410_063861 [Solanum commersonii]|uniref:Uncharacterized protein n=1 Tax=Solanum commersonii TaxID=4109 RepID=A0A9J5WFG7_SOLCO|nr:hypothetical protein H5410_063861 [Solanum commersonii]
MNNPLGRLLILAFTLTAGMPLYYAINIAGRPYDRFASHYDPYSPIYNDCERLQIYISDAVVNGFIVLITLLHHTHASLPHYDSLEWDWLRGVLATVDRDYGVLTKATKAVRPLLGEYYQFDGTPFYKAIWRDFFECIYIEKDDETSQGKVPLLIVNGFIVLITLLHHTHASSPHYHDSSEWDYLRGALATATNAIKSLVGEYYQVDDSPILKAMWRDTKDCIYVEKDRGSHQGKGVYWYKNKL